MDRQAVEKELNEIFNLFKACVDKKHLMKVLEDKGLIVNASILKEAEEQELKFASVFKSLVDIDASGSLKLGTISTFNKAFSKIGKGSTRPKNDPTQDAVQKKQEKEIEKILKENKKELQKPFNLGKIWDRAFIIEMERRYGKYNKETHSFLNNEGQGLISLKDLGSIQDYVKYIVNDRSRAIPRGWDAETIVDNVLAYIFYPEDSESLYDVLDTNLEKAKKEKKLPIEMTGLIINFVKNHITNYFKMITKKQFVTEGMVDSQIEELENLKKKLESASSDEEKLKIQKKIDSTIEELNTLKNKLNHQSNDLDESDTDSGVIPKHKFVDMDVSPSGEEVVFSPTRVEMVSDVKDAIKLLIEEDLQEDFSKFLKEKSDDLTFKIFGLVMENNDVNISTPAKIKELLQDVKATDSAISQVGNKLKNYLAEYASKTDDLDLLKSMDKYDLLPAKYKIKNPKNDEKNKKSHLEEAVSDIETRILAALNYSSEDKDLALKAIMDASEIIKESSDDEIQIKENDSCLVSESKVAKIVSYLELLSEKI